MSHSESDFLKNYNPNNFDRPNTTVDVVIYSLINSQLHVLVMQRENHPYKNIWALVGGFVDINHDETLEQTALRKLQEKTGVKSPYLEQYGSVGSNNRDPRYWSISTVYFALLPYESIQLDMDNSINDLKWLPLKNGEANEKLAFDHNQLIKSCTERLQSKVLYSSLPFYLLKQPFTLTELRDVYQIILEEDLEPKTFRRRMLGAKILEETGETAQSHSKKPAMLYKLKKEQPHYFRVLMVS